MHLLPLLLSLLFAVAWAQILDYETTPSSRRTLNRKWDRLYQTTDKFKKLPKEKKEWLSMMLGKDLDKRKARLERIMARRGPSLTEEERSKLQERLSKLTPIETERPDEKEPVDLFEVNRKSGIAEYLYQGDMDLSNSQMEELDTPEQPSIGARRKRQASTYTSKWTSNTVYFYFDPSLNARKRASVAAAHQYLQSRTCVNFVQSSTAANRIKVFNGDGCYSSIGMVGGEQTLSLGDGCEVIGTSAHEFTHALGVWHTQMRSDRDNFVTIDMTYVPQNYQGNFDKLRNADNYLYTPYEYGSFMHYSSNSFTNPSSQLSIVPKDMNYAYTMGNRQISFYDILMINKHYGCDAACTAANSAQCKNGGVPNPRNCAVCNCPLGYEGPLCDQRPTGCGETLTATTVWQTKQFSYGNTTDNVNTRDVFTYCNYWIKAPDGYNVQVKITNMWNSQCQFGCPFNGIEIKGYPDQKVTNPRFCCPEFNNQVLTSYLNPTPIIAFNRYYYTTFTIQFIAVPSSSVPPPPTTVQPPVTTEAPTTPVPTNCHDMLTTDQCIQNKNAGFCTSTAYDFKTIKYNCAVECGLCGKAAPNCQDSYSDCAGIVRTGQCGTLDPMVAEYHCALSCGFCSTPN